MAGYQGIRHWRLRDFDNMEFAASEGMTHSFPQHFHYEYMIGVSTAGLQAFADEEGTYIVPPRSILVMNPLQLHAHSPMNDIGWSHRSLYINEDVMRFLRPGGGRFARTMVQDDGLFGEYIRLHDRARPTADPAFDVFDGPELAALIGRVFAVVGEAEERPVAFDAVWAERIGEMRRWLDVHYENKLGLDGLAKRFSVDKYQLIRQFRKYTGVTPNVYLTIVRVERARNFLRRQVSVVEAALEAGFYDQAHFHRAFLHYTGMRPAEYRSQRGVTTQYFTRPARQSGLPLGPQQIR